MRLGMVLADVADGIALNGFVSDSATTHLAGLIRGKSWLAIACVCLVGEHTAERACMMTKTEGRVARRA